MATLTKSEYMMFLRHRALLWLKKYDKDKLPPIDANTHAMFDAGNRLETYAEALFPGAEKLGFSSYAEYQTLGDRTKAAIKAGAKTLFQARFDAGSLICLTDVVEFTGPQSLRLYEIKSSTRPKPEHEFDLAFQAVVLESLGYEVETCGLLHVNRDYVRNGTISSEELLVRVDLTEEVKAKRDLTKRMVEQAAGVIGQSARMPDISPRHCRLGSIQEWLKSYRLLRQLPENSIYDVVSPTAELIGQLEDSGIELLADIPDTVELSERQRRQVDAIRRGERRIDRDACKGFLDGLNYPLYFLDYETCADVIPPYDGTKPYQQVATQFSVHVLDAPGAELRHFEYIHTDNTPPGEPLAAALQQAIPDDGGTVLVWYAPFETGRNAEMAEALPAYREFFLGLNARTVDLMDPFANGHYTDPAFKGSSSIKNVLPALVPELSYKELTVQEGASAQRLWKEAALDGKGTKASREKLFADLLAYCKLDTLAMVEIFRRLGADV